MLSKRLDYHVGHLGARKCRSRSETEEPIARAGTVTNANESTP